jgi:argininosuccinate synthase
MKRIVLAYSGGRESSAALARLGEQSRADVVALTLDLGAGRELEEVRDRALASGAVRAHVIDAREEFARDFLVRALRAGALYDNGHSTATLLGRPLIARKLLEVAAIEQTDVIAHGCAADDTRITVAARALNPAITVVAAATDRRSADRAVSDARPPAECPDEAAAVQISFECGAPTAVNGIAMPLLDLIGSLDIIAGAHGVGRIDRLETPGAVVLHVSHRVLRTAVTTEEADRFSGAVSRQYRDLIDQGAWFTPLREALDAYVDKIQERVTGVVGLRLFKGTCEIVHRDVSTSPEGVAARRTKTLSVIA